MELAVLELFHVVDPPMLSRSLWAIPQLAVVGLIAFILGGLGGMYLRRAHLYFLIRYQDYAVYVTILSKPYGRWTPTRMLVVYFWWSLDLTPEGKLPVCYDARP
jgi:hypothetical protein